MPPRDSDKYYENVYAIYESSPEFFFSEYERIKAEFDSLEPFATPSAAYGGGKYLDMSLFGRVYDTVPAGRKKARAASLPAVFVLGAL